MNTCNCFACKPKTATALPQNLWKIGQAVKFWYHSPDYRSDSSGRLLRGSDGKLLAFYDKGPTLRYGVVIPYDSSAVEVGRDGIFVAFTDNKPNNGPFWEWDFMIESGIGYQSPIVEA